ncbi:MAG TPA: putative Ig domain-containing protein [Candidatus Acidoferrales bacterium]|nr:putative Ig domain-containing protein [Candidatus Acidoferrales bacterium]
MTRKALKYLAGSVLLLAGTALAAPQRSETPGVLDGIPVSASPPDLPSPGETVVVRAWRNPLRSLPQGRAESDIVRQVSEYLETNPPAMATASTPPLRLDYVQVVRGVEGVADTAYVRFVQTYKSLDVMGSQVVVTLRLEASRNVVETVETLLFPGARPSAGAGTMDGLRAAERVRSHLGPGVPDSTLQPLGERIRWLRGRWRTVQEFDVRGSGVSVAVDELTGQTDAWSLRQEVTYSGKVSGQVVLFNPQATLPSTVPLENVYVSDGVSAGVYTDASGAFQLTTSSTASLPVSLSGKWGTVIDQNLKPLVLTITAGMPSPIVLLFNPTGTPDTNTAQTNAYYHEDLIHNWIISRNIHPSGIDVPLPINVNWAANCNSYFDGYSINFVQAGNGCINTAYDTLIYHEYGHFIDSTIGGITDQALSEGWGDIMATWATNQSLFGEGFYAGRPDSYVRNASNTYQYSSNDEVHIQGQAWAGFAWDLRQSLIGSLGQDAGAALAENLVLPVFYNNSPDIPSAVRAVAVRDGLAGQTGGPHFPEILAAASNHGLGYILDIVPPTVTITFPSDGAANLSGTVTMTGTASDNVGVTNVVIEADGLQLGTASGTTAWSYPLDTTILPPGAHTLTALAFDAQGNQGTFSIRVTIAPSGRTALVTSVSVSGASLNNNTLPDWVGMVIRVGAAPITVTSLGRFYVAGNSGTHILKIADGVTGSDIPNASVSVSMAAPAFSQFVYADLPSPVTLSPGGVYYVVTKETSGGDFLYDGTVKVQTTGAAAVLGPVSYRRNWSAGAAPNQTYGPVDLKYLSTTALSAPVITSASTAAAVVGASFTYAITATNSPASYSADGLPAGLTINGANGIISGIPLSPGTFSVTLSATNSAGTGTAPLTLTVAASTPSSQTSFVTSFRLSSPSVSNTLPGWVGMAIQVGAAPVTVTSLGRIYVSGNTEMHAMKLVDAASGSDVPAASVLVQMSPPVNSQFVYADLPSPVSLAAGHVYYVVTQESGGGDFLYASTAALETTGAATVLGAVSYRRGWTFAADPNQSYGPVDFKYQTGASGNSSQ